MSGSSEGTRVSPILVCWGLGERRAPAAGLSDSGKEASRPKVGVPGFPGIEWGASPAESQACPGGPLEGT